MRVRYGECDTQKVVFNARYADYVDLSTTEFLRALGFGEALINGTFDYQLVKLTIEWKAPARFDQVLELTCYANNWAILRSLSPLNFASRARSRSS